MAFALPGHYVWDFWLARDGGTYHLFCLAAPKTAEHPDLRHPHARIHHATSRDLRRWTHHGIVIAPSAEPAWDDGVTWTGSVVRKADGSWMMFYTGASRAENCKIQRIGAAVSGDLHHWTKLAGNPLLEADPTHYETYDQLRWHDQAFRDPWVFADSHGRGWRMIFVAREPSGPPAGAGVLGQALSTDLMHWTASEPLFKASRYGEMEVPQLFELDGWWYCLFSNSVRHRLPEYVASGKCGRVTGTHYIRSRSPDGPFDLVEELFFAGDEVGHLYGGRTVETLAGERLFMAFLNHRADGSFVGSITDPLPLWTTPEGYLRIDATKYGMALRDQGLREAAAAG
jgi:beta-fructofuranosidase